jgi:hypothetical protein
MKRSPKAGKAPAFTADRVLRVREWYQQYRAVLTPKQMAHKEGVSRTTLMRAARGLTYKGIP